ncbi:MAG: hypothetical protein L6R42_007408, partial [Xanthoria sp. 1 TBL-2021]
MTPTPNNNRDTVTEPEPIPIEQMNYEDIVKSYTKLTDLLNLLERRKPLFKDILGGCKEYKDDLVNLIITLEVLKGELHDELWTDDSVM